jgi:hypothetical protein
MAALVLLAASATAAYDPVILKIYEGGTDASAVFKLSDFKINSKAGYGRVCHVDMCRQTNMGRTFGNGKPLWGGSKHGKCSNGKGNICSGGFQVIEEGVTIRKVAACVGEFNYKPDNPDAAWSKNGWTRSSGRVTTDTESGYYVIEGMHDNCLLPEPAKKSYEVDPKVDVVAEPQKMDPPKMDPPKVEQRREPEPPKETVTTAQPDHSDDKVHTENFVPKGTEDHDGIMVFGSLMLIGIVAVGVFSVFNTADDGNTAYIAERSASGSSSSSFGGAYTNTDNLRSRRGDRVMGGEEV